jgi:hypothetical protein
MRRTFMLSVVAALVASITLALTGVVVSSVHRKSIERGFDERLSAYMNRLMVGWVSADRRLEVLSQSVGEPLFDLPLSGWYWQITALDASTPAIRSSRSLWDTALTRLHDEDATTSPEGARHGYAADPMEQRLRLLERTVDVADDGRYVITVAGDASEIDQQMRFLGETISISFGFLAIFLTLTMLFQLRVVQMGLARQAPSL